MFDRFTDRARRVLVLAADEARKLNHNYLGTEHLLLGLIGESEGIAAKALESLGVSPQETRAEIESIIGTGHSAPLGQPPFTPRARRVLELSFKEALQLGHNYIGTEHILLGLVREGEGVAAQVLLKLGLQPGTIRSAVLKLLTDSGVEVREMGEETPKTRLSRFDRMALREGGPIAKALDDMGVSLEEFRRQVDAVGRREKVLEWLREGYPIAKAIESFGITLEDFRTRVEEILKEDEGGEPPEAPRPNA